MITKDDAKAMKKALAMSKEEKMNKLAYEINGEVKYLPQWCLLMSDEQIEKSKKTLINEAKNLKPKYESKPIVVDEPKIKKMLKSDGFTKSQIEEIIAMLYCGYTMDNAIQSVL